MSSATATENTKETEGSHSAEDIDCEIDEVKEIGEYWNRIKTTQDSFIANVKKTPPEYDKKPTPWILEVYNDHYAGTNDTNYAIINYSLFLSVFVDKSWIDSPKRPELVCPLRELMMTEFWKNVTAQMDVTVQLRRERGVYGRRWDHVYTVDLIEEVQKAGYLNREEATRFTKASLEKNREWEEAKKVERIRVENHWEETRKREAERRPIEQKEWIDGNSKILNEIKKLMLESKRQRELKAATETATAALKPG